MDFEVIKRLLAALEREDVRYAIFGAVAMGLHGLARFTEDLDLFVEPEAANIDRLRAALRSVVDDPEIEQITSADLLGDYPAVQYVPPDGTFHIDIVTRLGEALAFRRPRDRASRDGRSHGHRRDGARVVCDEAQHRSAEGPCRRSGVTRTV